VFISEQEVRASLCYRTLIPAIRQALVDYSRGLVDQPARMTLRAGNGERSPNGWFAVMPVIAGDLMAVKTVTFYPGNGTLGLHTHMAVIELLSRATGEPLAVMDGRVITEMRTAAVSAVALDALGSPAVGSLGILGSGVQARSHVQALRMVRPGLRDIRIWSRTRANAERLAAEVGGRAANIEEAAQADVVLTVTSTPVPVLEGRWLGLHSLVLAVGAVGAALRELDDEVMQSSLIVAESRSCAERESGDVQLSGTNVDLEIGEIVSGRVAAPTNRRIVFKSVGMAIEDLTGARLVWQARSDQAQRQQ
jgi:ornithine cyclodeaminase/alanine dehydrogenase-like protein (mu-crystallin family)